MSATIKAVNIEQVREFFDKAPGIAKQAMSMSINQVATRKAEPGFRKKMRSQVNFPRGYLESDGRFGMAKKAKPSDLEAIIRGRDRPTSLARFQQYRDARVARGKKLKIQVKPGTIKTSDKAFLVNLNNNNLGLAIRLKDGQKPQSAYKPTLLDAKRNVWLLYGPSVDQVFNSVADDSMGEISSQVQTEFERNFARMVANG